jgi:hypothetical protein
MHVLSYHHWLPPVVAVTVAQQVAVAVLQQVAVAVTQQVQHATLQYASLQQPVEVCLLAPAVISTDAMPCGKDQIQEMSTKVAFRRAGAAASSARWHG